MITLKIGGVPEHFNFPWHIGIKKNLFDNSDLSVEWHYYKGGTGEMVGKLDSGELDIAILLTEGFLSAYAKGLNALIAKEYITTPLVWGIYTGYNSTIDSVYNESAKRIAISRPGSGSHLMALIHAEQRGESIDEFELVEVKSLEGAVNSLVELKSDLFYWEKYTTKPHIVSKELRLIGEFSAPWSSFMIAVNKNSYANKKGSVVHVLDKMNSFCKIFKSENESINLLSSHFGMTKVDSEDWLRQTVWKNGYTISKKSLDNARLALSKINSSLDLPPFEDMVTDEVVLK